jgi:hypothetical protein
MGKTVRKGSGDSVTANFTGPFSIGVIGGTKSSASLPYTIEWFSQDVVVGGRVCVNRRLWNDQDVASNWCTKKERASSDFFESAELTFYR